jgi:hypothetical protein
MTVRVSLHAYQSDPSLPQRDGVNISQTEIVAMLRRLDTPDIRVEFHDFGRLCSDRRYAADVLSKTDCVLSVVGPHAHYYHHLREQLGLEFRILRDVRTALWSSYLLQEALCQPLLRPGDALITPSRYARGLIRRILPHLRTHPIVVFESMFASGETTAGSGVSSRRRHRQMTLGYVGRLSEDKNFPQLVDLLIRLNRDRPRGYRLLACGHVHSPSCDPTLLQARIRSLTGHSDLFEYHPARDHAEVWDLYHRFDAFLFPSTSNLETLGRVLSEASRCGVPILASEHAAAPELLPAEALSPVRYDLGNWYPTHFDYPLGTVDIDDMRRKLHEGALVTPDCHRNYPNDPLFLQNLLLGRLEGRGATHGGDDLTPAQRRFLDLIDFAGLNEYRDPAHAQDLISELCPWFTALQNKSSPDYQQRLTQLSVRSRFPERTRKFVAKSTLTRGDFTNLGGVDIELCHVARFWPRFRLVTQDEIGRTRPESAKAAHTVSAHTVTEDPRRSRLPSPVPAGATGKA